LKGDPIREEDHVLRHVKARYIENGDISGGAFRLRKDETELSFNWMEFYRQQSLEEQVALVRQTFPLQVKGSELFVRLNVGQAKTCISQEHPEKKTINFIEDGDTTVPSHCLMTGSPDIDDMIGDLLVHCILERFPAIA
jgi:hypothetical protein